jgi:hypothetical protein
MVDRKGPCRKQREILLDIFLSKREKANLPPDLSRHMESCDACSRYWNSLGSIRSAYPQEPLYSPFLRAKTLRRLTGGDPAIKLKWMPAIALASLLSVSFSFVIPAWLLAKIFSYWTSSTAMACGAALGILLVGGMLVTAVAAFALIERGYIRFDNEEDTRVRAGTPSAAGMN